MRTLLAMMAAIILAGCQTKTLGELSYSETKQLAGDFVKRCLDQGVKAGTAEMDMCLRQEILRERTTRDRAARIQDAAASAPRMKTFCQNINGTVICT